MKSVFDKMNRKGAGEWLTRINPIARLSISEARAIYDAARAYGSPRLQKIYDEIELTDPVLMTCVERRQSALASLGFKVTVRPDADPTLAAEQKDAAERFLAQIDNMTAALEHLDLAFFRGFSHVQPLWDGNSVSHINLLDSWNFLTDETGAWLWNPEALPDPRGCFPITPEARLVSLCRRRAIDYPALTIFIRKSLGEQDWGRFIERYGIPPVDVVMAPNTTDAQEQKYLECAEAARDGNPTAWPSNSQISRAEGSRGQDPFTAFIEHQEKLIVLAATGGTLTSLAQADTGALAGGAQMDVWEQIVARDAVVIADAFERSLVKPFVFAAFPNQPVAVNFELGRDKKATPKETAELAATLKTAGYSIDLSELQEAVGFTLTKDETPVAAPGMPFTAKAKGATVGSAVPADRVNTDLLSAFTQDSTPLANAIKELLKNPSKENCEKLIADLPKLMPEDPEMAAIIAEEMAKEFKAKDEGEGEEIARARQGEKCPDCGQWLDANGVCHDCHGADELAKMGYNPDSDEMQNAEIGKGKAAISKCLKEQVDVLDAVSRSDIGMISFIFGSPVDTVEGKAHGLSHLFEKHKGDGIVENLAESLIRGKVREPGKTGNKIAIDWGGYEIHLAKTFSRKGSPISDKYTWVITGFKTDKEDA